MKAKREGACKQLFLLLIAASVAAVAARGWCAEQARPDTATKKTSAAEDKNADQAEQKRAEVRLPKFVPPKRGAPVGRIAGGARGHSEDLPELLVLTPDYAVTSASPSPALYWYTSAIPPWPVEITVTERRAVTPLLVRRLPPPTVPGIQRASLEELGARLEPGRDYRWFIALVRDDQRRSRDLLACGGVRWEPPATELLAAVDRAGLAEQPSLYAEAGYWYEAMDAAMRLADTGKGSTAPRDRLLAQVGLEDLIAR